MSLKKLFTCALAAACALSLLVPAAFAHGGCHGRSARRAAQPCAVEDCTLAGWHYHGRTLYCGHTHGSGHGLCDGSCAPLCEVDGCTLAGRHVHDGVTYCGASHACGWCDGSCPFYQTSGGACGARRGCHH